MRVCCSEVGRVEIIRVDFTEFSGKRKCVPMAD